ncbi:v-type proton ATPase subunit G, partial [Haematococcus lacustris]
MHGTCYHLAFGRLTTTEAPRAVTSEPLTSDAGTRQLQRLKPSASSLKPDKARAEADREVAAYKAEREGAYQKKVAEGSSGAQVTLQRLNTETTVTVQRIQGDVKAKKQQVVDLLNGYVTSVSFS